ncbi:MAG TPA: O-antigen ligase family protein [Flavobacteriaceae bacterium]|nr:O-antigen ligase family protein [Flavobacteriaceae bacterium]
MSVILTIGLISGLNVEYFWRDIIKDFVYFARPIVLLLAAYYCVKRIHSTTFVFNTVVVLSAFFALKHLFVILVNFSNIDSYVYLRGLGGKQNHIELVGLVFLFFTPYVTVFKRYRKLVVYIISLSFILYLSRTMFILLFVFYIAYKGYMFFNKKFLKGLFVFFLVAIALGITISSVETNRDSTGFKAFIYKTQNSFSEVFKPINTKEIVNDRRELWEHWRAYEASKAIEQIEEVGPKAWLVGMGFGAQVDLETYVYLDGEKYYEVPSIHNGFVNVLFKTGILGLALYLLFISLIFVNNQKFKSTPHSILYNKMLLATSIYMLYNSFVITGFFRPGEFSIFLFGIWMATKVKNERMRISQPQQV